MHPFFYPPNNSHLFFVLMCGQYKMQMEGSLPPLICLGYVGGKMHSLCILILSLCLPFLPCPSANSVQCKGQTGVCLFLAGDQLLFLSFHNHAWLSFLSHYLSLLSALTGHTSQLPCSFHPKSDFAQTGPFRILEIRLCEVGMPLGGEDHRMTY